MNDFLAQQTPPSPSPQNKWMQLLKTQNHICAVNWIKNLFEKQNELPLKLHGLEKKLAPELKLMRKIESSGHENNEIRILS